MAEKTAGQPMRLLSLQPLALLLLQQHEVSYYTTRTLANRRQTTIEPASLRMKKLPALSHDFWL